MKRVMRRQGCPISLSVRLSLVIVLSCVMTPSRASVNCRTGIRDISNRAFVAPLVFEATVTASLTHPDSPSQSAKNTDKLHSPSSHHEAIVQVAKVYRGDFCERMRNCRNSGSRTNAAGLSTSLSSSKVNGKNVRTANNEVRLEFWSKPDRAVYPECTFNSSLFEIGGKYIVFASVLSPAKMLESAPRYTLFSEPVRQNKTSSRHVRKVLCAACASPPNVTDVAGKFIKDKNQIRITCKTAGNPTPSITWYHGGNLLEPSRRVRITQKKNLSKLVINSAKVKDSGDYECRAISEFSPAASRKTKVVVPRRPSPVPSTTTTTSVITSWAHKGTECPVKNFCLNGGKCTFFGNIGEHQCVCAEGYNGGRCETKVVQNRPKPETMYLKSIFIVVVILGVLFSVFATYIVCRKKRCKKKKTKATKRSSDTFSAGDTIAMLPQDGPTANRTEIIPQNINFDVVLQRVNDNMKHDQVAKEENSDQPFSNLDIKTPVKILEKQVAHRTTRLYGVSSDSSSTMTQKDNL